MNEVKQGIYKSRQQKSILHNIETFYKSRNNAIKYFDSYSSMISEAKHKTFHRKSHPTHLEILNPKTFNITSENFLNKISQIIYYLYQAN